MVRPDPEKRMRGPSHSAYSKVVVPSKVTVVPSARSLMSRVVSAGTVIPDRTIDEHDALDATAASTSVKVQPAEAVVAATAADALELVELLLLSDFSLVAMAVELGWTIELATAVPDGTTAVPEGVMAVPDGTMAVPDGTTANAVPTLSLDGKLKG